MGTYTQNAGGSLDIDSAGTTAGTKFDALNTTTAVLGGTLNITSVAHRPYAESGPRTSPPSNDHCCGLG